MAHNLNFNNQLGRHAFVSVKERPWHGLGKIISKAMTLAEGIIEGGLDWTVEKVPNLTTVNGEMVKTPNSFSIVRKDTGVILADKLAGKYEIIQNLEAFAPFENVFEKGEAMIETAGALFDGQVVFMTAKLPDYIRIGKDDLIEKYLFFKTTHDTSGKLIGGVTPTRIVCNNTLNAALSNCSNSIAISHTASCHDKLKIAVDLMGITNQYTNDLQEAFSFMAKKPFLDAQLKEMVHKIFAPKLLAESVNPDDFSTRMKNLTSGVMEYALSSPTQQMDTTRGTAFGAYNAITGYFQNVKTYKNADKKMESIILGGTANRMGQRAFDLALAM